MTNCFINNKLLLFAKNICFSDLNLVPLHINYANQHIKHNNMPFPSSINAKELSTHIEAYFTYIKGEYQVAENFEKLPAKGQKIWGRDPEPPTLTGLAFFLGFSSKQEFVDYEDTGKHAQILKRSRLRIEAFYEKKLHEPSSTGIIFALKNMGWNEKPEAKSGKDVAFTSIKIEVKNTGPDLASDEKDVVI